VPGTVEVFKGGGPDVVCLMAQHGPGRANRSKWPDTPQLRLRWFREALARVAGLGYAEVAVPYKIGCGLAGGDWGAYRLALGEFERDSGVGVVVYQRAGDA